MGISWDFHYSIKFYLYVLKQNDRHLFIVVGRYWPIGWIINQAS